MEHTEGHFKGTNGLNLFYQRWLPAGEPQAILLVVHGLAEHCGRYANLAQYLAPRGLEIYSFDLRGHGQSDGLKGDVDDFSYYLQDLDIFLGLVQNNYPGKKIFLLGHSMGGTVATAYAIQHQDKIHGLILSGALLSPPKSVSAGTILIARLLASILPQAGLYYIDASAISRDSNVVKAYVEDSLVYHGKIRARLGVNLLRTMSSLKHLYPRIQLPVLILHGSADKLSPCQDSQTLYSEIISDDKTLRLYEGYFHEIFNEPGREKVLEDVVGWLRAHI